MKHFKILKSPLFYGLIGFFSVFTIFIFPNAVALDDDGFEFREQTLLSVLKNDPNNLQNLEDLATLYYQNGICNKSIDIFDKILELKPKNPEVIFAKANCLNTLGLPNESLLALDNIGNRYANDNAVLITKGNSHLRLLEFDKAEQYYQTVLRNDPDNRTAINNMIIVAKEKNDIDKTEKYLVKHVGKNPSPSDLNPDSGNMGYTMQINNSDKYTVSLQVQIRSSTDELIAIVESEKILFIPHPLIYEIIDNPKLITETIQTESGNYEIRKIVVENKPELNAYFLDRVILSSNSHMIFFAYNMGIPLEDGDRIIEEWTIKKKID
mgnify:CR=1 FL=1|tara:strand:+ start:227 stop:1198 length:972 start_codon:yes stop_codon:yes gene_type:complete